jgi:hypothetical protein
MKHKLKLIRWFAAALPIVVTMLFSITSARAQCPDDSYGIPPSIISNPWYGEDCTTQLLPGTSCHIEICYCHRLVGTVTQVYITSIVGDDDGSCDGISNESIIKQARTLVLNGLAGVPCYKGAPEVMEVYTAQCWQTKPSYLPGGGQGPYGLYPCPDVAWCRKTCYVCYDEHGAHVSGCTTDPANISQVCNTVPPLESPWHPEVCYTISCED